MSGDDKVYDVIFHWGELTSWLGEDWKKYFSKDTVDVLLPRGSGRNFGPYKQAITAQFGARPIHNALTKRGLPRQGGRVGVIGFSETCIGAAVLLRSPDGGVIDFIYANDGIHGSVPYWTEYAKQAAFGHVTNLNSPPTERCLVITHSQTPSPGKGIPSTSESAEIIAKAVQAEPVYTEFVDIPELKDAPHEPVDCYCSWSKERVTYDKIPGLYNTKIGNLYIFGYENQGKTCTDHIYQSKVIGPRVMKHIIAPRWNENDRDTGSCVVI